MAANPKNVEEMTQAGLNLIGQALSIYDAELRLVVCNRRFQEMFDLPPSLATPGASFEDTIRHLVQRGEYGQVEDSETFVQSRVQQASAFEPHYMERTRANGRTISVEGSPLPQGGWVTVYTDITRAKRSEKLLRTRSEELSDQLLSHAEELSSANRELAATITALEETKRQLTEMEARTRLTTEMMPAHIAHVDTAGVYTFSNRRLSSVMPGRPQDIVGLEIADALGPTAFQKIEPHLMAAYDGRASVFEFTDVESSRRIRVAFTPEDRGGVYILSMDITEETQARVALQQTRRRALAAQMTSGIAHDFSNLLTIILGMQSKLQRMDVPQEAQVMIDATIGAARRGGRLLNRIGDITGSRTYQPQPTDVKALLQDLKTLATPTLPQSVGLSILDHMPPDLLLLDAGMVHDGLLNLILNARDACGTSGQITVTAHTVADTWVEIGVSDTGPGFSDEALEKALNPFFTTKGGEGSGLGLPMVYDMAKLAGGDLRLSNTPSGACVTLRLPLRRALTTSGGLALLVEDNDTLRTGFRDMLISMDFSVIEATTADEALALCADLPDICLCLSDVKLAGNSTGIDLVRRLGESGLHCLLMTSLPPEDPLFAQAARAAPLLRKPFTARELALLIKGERAA